jgi:hypothetical protein
MELYAPRLSCRFALYVTKLLRSYCHITPTKKGPERALFLFYDIASYYEEARVNVMSTASLPPTPATHASV